MYKWEERIHKILDSERERVEQKLYEAYGNYRDTGYSRYTKQIDKLEKELCVINTYIDGPAVTVPLELEAKRYEDAIREYRTDMLEFRGELPELYMHNARGMVDHAITKLDIILGDKGL